jgi:hypothetical protein
MPDRAFAPIGLPTIGQTFTRNPACEEKKDHCLSTSSTAQVNNHHCSIKILNHALLGVLRTQLGYEASHTSLLIYEWPPWLPLDMEVDTSGGLADNEPLIERRWS